jgi:hypothetical protein
MLFLISLRFGVFPIWRVVKFDYWFCI